MLNFQTAQPFDEVQLFAANGIAVLSSINVYNAFEGPAAYGTDWVNALTGSDVSATRSTGSIPLLTFPVTVPCVTLGTVITNPGRVTDTDTTDFATIGITASLSCAF